MNAYASGWPRFGDSGSPAVAGELSTAANPRASPSGRRSERVLVEFGAGLRQRGASGVSVQVMDLSAHGFRVATHLDLPVGTDVWLRLPGIEASHAKVVWAQGHYVGCAFERPLHQAVVDMIVSRAQSR